MTRPPRRSPGIAVAASDLALDAFAGMRARPGRTWASILMTAVGVATAIAVLGIGETGKQQIDSTFDRFQATTVRVESDVGGRLGEESVTALDQIPNVDGTVLVRASASAPVTARPGLADPQPVQILEAADGNLAALGPGLPQTLPPRTAVVGTRLRDTLDIAVEGVGTAIWVDGIPYTIAGFTPDSVRFDAAQSAVLVGPGGLDHIGAVIERDILIMKVVSGAASDVAAVAATATLPSAPSTLSVIAPPEPAALRSTISGDVRVLTLAASGLMIVLGVLAIASSVALAVAERTGEIGLRRVLGAHRRHIANLILFESGATGLCGGVIGAATGVAAISVYATWNRWTAAYEPALVAVAVGVGLVAGLTAGLAPALRATKIDPSTALNHAS